MKSILYLFNSKIEFSGGKYGGILQANYFSLIIIINCSFSNNFALETLFELTDSDLHILNTTFFGNSNNLIYSISSNLFFKGISLKNHKCNIGSEGCIISMTENSLSYIIDSIIINVSSANKNSIVVVSSNSHMSNLSFFNTTSSLQLGSCFSGYNALIDVFNVDFYLFFGNAIYLEESSIEIINSKFYMNHNFDATKFKFGALVCIECIDLNIVNSLFLNNSFVYNGAAIYLSNIFPKLFGSEKIIMNTSFVDNQVFGSGGGMYLHNQNITINNCSFYFNEAVYGAGIFSWFDGLFLFLFYF